MAGGAEQCGPGPRWHEIELNNAVSLVPPYQPSYFQNPTFKIKSFSDNLFLCNTIKILKQIKGILNLPGMSIYAPICQNPCFKPGLMDAVFKRWSDKGLTIIKDLYVDDHFVSFAQLQTKFKLPTNHFFRYLQIRNFVKQSFSCLDPTHIHVFYDIMTKPPTSKHLISRLVSLIFGRKG